MQLTLSNWQNNSTQRPLRPTLLAIGGNDCSGLAGLTMDSRTAQAFGVHMMPAVTANTVQSPYSIDSINPVSNSVLQSQITACLQRFPEAIKIGLVANHEQLEKLAALIDSSDAPVIFDPVIQASSGQKLISPDTSQHLHEWLQACIEYLLPKVTLVTPNIYEVERLTGIKISQLEDFEVAAQALRSLGANHVLITGGHFKHKTNSGVWSHDFYCGENESFWLSNKFIDSINTRGTGCALATSIASTLALGASIEDAVVIGKMAVHQGIRKGYGIGSESGPIAIESFPRDLLDLPLISKQQPKQLNTAGFPRVEAKGIYPIVDRAHWIDTLAPLGVQLVQLRIKDLAGDALKEELQNAVLLGKKHHCEIWINDHWQLAIDIEADGVHLGQDDLNSANIDAIKMAGLKLGISTHCHYEVARAHALQPSYIAVGPVFPTQTKSMPWRPLGIEGVKYWREVLNYPLVAIGGIDQSNLSNFANTGIEMIAMISAITQSNDPVKSTQKFIETLNND